MMTEHGFLAQVFARNPAKSVRFPEIPLDAALGEMTRVQQTLQEVAQMELTHKSPTDAHVDEMGALLSRLATHVWRARNRMVDSATGEAREEMKKPFRNVEGAIDTLAEHGVVTQDWVNQPYDVGLPVKVLSYQPTPGLTQDLILETIRPAVLWKGRMLQLGEVIVGTPEATAPHTLP